MADFCCRFLDFQKPLACKRNLHLFFPWKHNYSPALVHSRNSRIFRIKTGPFHKTLLIKPFASDFDVISTHEHSDGSLLFRFGDPTEVAKNVKMEEPNSEDEIKTRDEDGYSVVKVFDGDRESEVIIKKADREVTISGSVKFADHTNSTVHSSENIAVIEGEVDSREKLLDGSNDVELPVYVSSKHSGNVEEGVNDEYEEQNEIVDVVGDGYKGDAALSEEIMEWNLQTDNLIIDRGSESEMNDIAAIGMQNVVVGNDNGSEMNEAEAKLIPLEDGIANEFIENGSESLKVLNNIDENVQSGEIFKASVPGLAESKSTESATKSQELLTTHFVLSSGAALLPHPSKVLTGGEDAYFIAGQSWLGVADGVGQWSLEGTNQGVYAQELVKNCERLISDCNGESVGNPVELLKRCIAETRSPGSSTVLTAQVDGQALNVANVGDSGFIVIRKGVVYKRSSPMHHAFHFPILIERGDDPSSLAELYRVDLEEDDVIITATDGLLDNLYDQEISSIVRQSLAADNSLEEIAELLAKKAQEIGRSGSTRSPFADDVRAAGFAKYSGGKLDDVAVIVSLVQRQSNSETR